VTLSNIVLDYTIPFVNKNTKVNVKQTNR